MKEQLPLPSASLRRRVGPIRDGVSADERFFLAYGKVERDVILSHLPQDWTWPGRRVLDFGCGSGRTLRHFVTEASVAEFWGSDIDERSIEWLQEHLTPPFRFILNGEVPPLDLEHGKFDLVYAYSVFTHLSTHWAGWLLEMHRLLKPGGLLLATVMSEAMCASISGEPWNGSNVGMNVYEEGQEWDLGGPMVLHSQWWIESHWGRLFEIIAFDPAASVSIGDRQGVVVAQKTELTATFEELVALDPAEPREASALHHDVLHLRAEVAELRRALRRATGG